MFMASSFWIIYLVYILLVLMKYRHDNKQENELDKDSVIETELEKNLDETQISDLSYVKKYGPREPRKSSDDISISESYVQKNYYETNDMSVHLDATRYVDNSMINYDKKFANFEAKFNEKNEAASNEKKIIAKDISIENSILINASNDYIDPKNETNCANKFLSIMKSPFKSILEFTIFPVEINNLNACFLPWYPVTATAAALF